MEFKTYLFTYNFDGAKWELPIKAKTPEEARARLNHALYAEYTGELMTSIPVSHGMPSIMSAIARWFRLFR